MRVKRVLVSRAVLRALSRPAPPSIPISGSPAVTRRHYFTVRLRHPESQKIGFEYDFLAKKTRPTGVEGVWFGATTLEPSECSISWDEVANFETLFTHYLGEIQNDTKSAGFFLVRQYLCLDWMELYWRRLRVWLFGLKRLALHERMTVLEHIVNETLNNDEHKTSESGLVSRFHGPMAFEHPDCLKLFGRYTLILKSLLDAGDLSIKESCYILTGKGLTTFTEHQRDERRHDQNLTQQRGLKWLTCVLALLGVAELFKKFEPITIQILFP